MQNIFTSSDLSGPDVFALYVIFSFVCEGSSIWSWAWHVHFTNGSSKTRVFWAIHSYTAVKHVPYISQWTFVLNVFFLVSEMMVLSTVCWLFVLLDCSCGFWKPQCSWMRSRMFCWRVLWKISLFFHNRTLTEIFCPLASADVQVSP